MSDDREIIYYDGACGVCTAGIARFRRTLESRGFALEPLQIEGVAQMLGLLPGVVPDEMKLKTRDGRILGGADALVYIARRIWWAWPVFAISKLPGAMPVIRCLYRALARNRYRISRASACTIPRNHERETPVARGPAA